MKKSRTTRRLLRRMTALLLALLGGGMIFSSTADLSALGQSLSPEPSAAADQAPSLPFWQRLLLGESPLLAQWIAKNPAKAPDVTSEDAEENQELAAVTPEDVQERTITGAESSVYTNTGGIYLFNNTSKSIDLPAVAAAGVSLSLGSTEQGPQILIVHTHATEAYALDPAAPYTESGTAHTTDVNYNIIRVGDEVARIFTEMGLYTLHDTTLYDYPSYNGAYTRSKAGIEALLAQYPSIQVVLDLHRDALVGSDGTIFKPVVTVDGVKTAQVMLLVGSDDGGASFPDWTQHLALAARMQQRMNSLWPGLARPIAIRSARFNQQLTPGSLLVEVGAHGNTLEEALAGARLFARAAGQVLLELQQ